MSRIFGSGFKWILKLKTIQFKEKQNGGTIKEDGIVMQRP
jgi:hypothetical protein